MPRTAGAAARWHRRHGPEHRNSEHCSVRALGSTHRVAGGTLNRTESSSIVSTHRHSCRCENGTNAQKRKGKRTRRQGTRPRARRRDAARGTGGRGGGAGRRARTRPRARDRRTPRQEPRTQEHPGRGACCPCARVSCATHTDSIDDRHTRSSSHTNYAVRSPRYTVVLRTCG